MTQSSQMLLSKRKYWKELLFKNPRFSHIKLKGFFNKPIFKLKLHISFLLNSQIQKMEIFLTFFSL
jgi:hypothetical protein